MSKSRSRRDPSPTPKRDPELARVERLVHIMAGALLTTRDILSEGLREFEAEIPPPSVARPPVEGVVPGVCTLCGKPRRRWANTDRTICTSCSRRMAPDAKPPGAATPKRKSSNARRK